MVLGNILAFSRKNRRWEARRVWAAIILQRQIRKYVAWKLQERINCAARTIMRYIRRWQIRKLLRNRRKAAHAIMLYVVKKAKAKNTTARVRLVLQSTRKAQKAVRNHQLMWRTRAKVHVVQWERSEHKFLMDLRELRSPAHQPADISERTGEIAGVPTRIPRHVRAAVLARFTAEAREHHVKKCKDYNNSKSFFLKFKAKEACPELAEAREVGAIPFNMSLWEYLRQFRPDIYEKRPERPAYAFTLDNRTLEKLFLDAVELYQLEKAGTTTAEEYAAGACAFLLRDKSETSTRVQSRAVSRVSVTNTLVGDAGDSRTPFH